MADEHDLRQDDATPRAEVSEEQAMKDGKVKKRSLFGFGKKKTEEPAQTSNSSQPPPLPHESSKLSSAPSTGSQNDAVVSPSSPNRALSSSPRLASPARSQIFERDVQEEMVLASASPAIPTHIQTENYIPPALDGASEVITNEKLDPDSVEIVTHNAHQPASVTVTGSTPNDQVASNWVEELASFENRDMTVPDNASHYGSLDSADVRRLSFISFADVVQSEHSLPNAAGSRDSIHMAGLTSLTSANLNRSPSPIRSPVSSQGGPGTSPPTSNPGSIKGLEMSPPRKALGSPISGTGQSLNPPQGDLSIETMSQALRRTGSADLSNARSTPASPIDGLGSR